DAPFPYEASFWAPFVLCGLFGIAWLVHVGQAIRFKSLFMWVILVAGTLEWLGYMWRYVALLAASSYLVVSQTFLIVTPALLVAQCYIVVERMMAFVGKEYGFTDHQEIAKIFLGADVVAIVMQVIGSSILTDARGDLSQAKVAKKILVAGLLLQIITFGIYSFFAAAFDFRSSRDPALRVYGTQMKGLRKLWITFYVSAVLITLRSIYRAVEFADIAPSPRGIYDPDKYLFTHEWPFYVFDAIPILISVVAFAIWHPGAYLPSRKGLRIDGTYQEQQGWSLLHWCGLRKPHQRGLGTGAPASSTTALQSV
ncbi:hypothetical protein M407DRAFT_227185, partial [Tulasnella calospora MUT 4182]